MLPIQCPGCSQKFRSDQTFTHHLEEEAQCDAGGDDAEPIKGLENLLEKIKPTNNAKNTPMEEDMWKALYRTLFPDDPKDQIPSPCKYLRPFASSEVVANFCQTRIR